MHDREDAGPQKEIALDRPRVGKQGRHIGMRMRVLRAGKSVDFAAGQELAEGAALGVVLNAGGLDERRRARVAVAAGMIDGAFDPVDGREVDAVLVRKVAANPDRGGHRVERNADPPVLEILGRVDAGLAVDVDVAVAEDARREHRQRYERAIAARHPADEFGAGEFRNVEFLLCAHAVENIARVSDRLEIEVDILDGDVTGAKRIRAVVDAAGKSQPQM